jgi:hypothetical protein
MQPLILHAVVRCKYCPALRLHVQDQYMLNLCLCHILHSHALHYSSHSSSSSWTLLRAMHSYCQGIPCRLHTLPRYKAYLCCCCYGIFLSSTYCDAAAAAAGSCMVLPRCIIAWVACPDITLSGVTIEHDSDARHSSAQVTCTCIGSECV